MNMMKRVAEYMFIVILAQILFCTMAVEVIWPFQNAYEFKEFVIVVLDGMGIRPVYLYIAGRVAGMILLTLLFFEIRAVSEKRRLGKV